MCELIDVGVLIDALIAQKTHAVTGQLVDDTTSSGDSEHQRIRRPAHGRSVAVTPVDISGFPSHRSSGMCERIAPAETGDVIENDDATIVGRTACNFQGATDIERMHDDVGQGSSGTPARRRETLVGAGTEE